ncbi:MAG TPA: ABC transporter permease [Bryobacteraceae bacterium]|jgi:putative ABC transport system permease protein|nr:ABC transporter permease [Bryobacteraceae bacterium]
MAIPVAYNFRNLVVRKTTTLMTALGIALTVAVLLAMMALLSGLRATLSSSGDPLQIVVMRKGSESELVSNFTREQFQDLKFKPGIARAQNGDPMASLEIVTVINLPSVDSPEGGNVLVRGLLPIGLELRKGLKISSGRWFNAGKRELVVGKSTAQRYPGAALGKHLSFGRGDWEVVGVFDAGQSAQNSEVLGDLNQISTDLDRTEVLSSALVRAADSASAGALLNSINDDQRLNMNAVSEKEYYALQTVSARPIEFLGVFVCIVMAVGSSFAAMNTMYAAVARRAREIGTLRVLGFSRGSILFSFFLESVLLAGLGGILGCLLVFPLNGVTTGMGSTTFSELAFSFRVTPQIMLAGIIFAALLGAFGGLFPARNAARKEILVALREV